MENDEDFDRAGDTIPSAVLIALTEVFNLAASVADLQQDELAQEEIYDLINSLADYFGIEYTVYGVDTAQEPATNILHSGADAEPRLSLLEADDDVVYLPDREFAQDDDEDDDEDTASGSN